MFFFFLRKKKKSTSTGIRRCLMLCLCEGTLTLSHHTDQRGCKGGWRTVPNSSSLPPPSAAHSSAVRMSRFCGRTSQLMAKLHTPQSLSPVRGSRQTDAILAGCAQCGNPGPAAAGGRAAPSSRVRLLCAHLETRRGDAVRVVSWCVLYDSEPP